MEDQEQHAEEVVLPLAVPDQPDTYEPEVFSLRELQLDKVARLIF